MFAFLFNAQHESIDDPVYGPHCTSKVVAGIEALDPIPASQLLRGEIVFGFLVYKIAKVSTGPSGLPDYGGGPTNVKTISYAGNEELNLTLICDLAETLSQPPSTVAQDDVMLTLARSAIWCIVTPSLSLEQAIGVDNHIRGFAPYMGMAALDLGNPTHRHIMIENMVGGVYLDSSGIHYQIDSGLDQADIDEATWIAESFGSSIASEVEEYGEYIAGEPSFEVPTENSQRGDLSAERVAGHLTDTHRQKAARVILEYFDGVPKTESLEFVASSSSPSDFIVEEKKLTLYLLNVDHKDGGPKAKFFIEKLGILPEDWRYLAEQLSSGAAKAKLYRVKATQFGYSHGAYVAVTGRNGKVYAVETGWQIPNEGPARLITAYPADKGILVELETTDPVVVAISLSGDARWQAVYDIAHAKGVEAVTAKVATPMVLEKFGTVWDGMCGFGWVDFTDARKPFPKWLVKKGLAYATSPGVRMFSNTNEQSIDKNKAYAEAFAKVLQANGVECSTGSRLD